MRRRNFSTSCLTENSSVRFGIRTKLRPLRRTDFSESVRGRFSGIVTTVFWLSNVARLLILGPIKCPSFRVLIWFKWLKSVALSS